jgi:hypothetical protein
LLQMVGIVALFVVVLVVLPLCAAGALVHRVMLRSVPR